MPSPTSYYLDPYRRSRNGPGGGPSARYAQSQYPSPTDSNSSRGHRSRDVEMARAFEAQHIPRAVARNPSTYIPHDNETDSLEFVPSFSMIQSSRYPDLHFLLARDSAQLNAFALDMRDDPLQSVSREVLGDFGVIWVTRDRPVHLRIVSPDFPWVIDIKADETVERQEHGITCGDVWSGLYRALHEPIQDSDWAHLSEMAVRYPNSDARARHGHLVNVARHQQELGEPVSLLRLHWLVGKTIFTGLEKDEDYSLSARRLLPGTERCIETWVAHFTEHG